MSDLPNVRMISMEQGGFLLRSVVEYLPDGRVTVGRRTLPTKSVIEGNVVMNMKRIIGRKFNSEEVKSFAPMCKADVVEGPNGFAAFRIPALQDRILLPEEVCSKIIRVIYERALTILDKRYKLKCMAISVPAYFNQEQRNATCNAVKFAGITLPVYVINEPSAAALSFGIENEFKNGNVVTYDLGGGTFDVTVMKVRNGKEFEVLTSSGINNIGGETFDECVLRYIADEYHKTCLDCILPSTSSPLYYRAFCRLQEKCREAKEALSSGIPEVEVDVNEYIHGIMVLGHNPGLQEVVDLYLSLSQLNQLIEDSIKETFDKMNECIRTAGLTKQDISKVVLVGGSSRLLLVKSMLESEFGNCISQAMKVDECVSSGAAIYAHEVDMGTMSMDDVTKYNIYTCPGNKSRKNYKLLIEKGSALPVKVEKIFRTCEDHLGIVKDELYKGTSKEDIQLLASMKATGITEYDDGRAVELKYTICIAHSGVLTYSVQEVESGKILVQDRVVDYKKYCVS